MARHKSEFAFKTVRRMKDVERSMKRGWELVESSGAESGFWGSTYNALLRRPKGR